MLAQSGNHFSIFMKRYAYSSLLTLVLLNPDMTCLCKQCRARSVVCVGGGGGGLGVVKVSCILPHRSIQLILAYSWARPAILVAGKGRGGNVFLFLLFLSFHSCSSFFPVPLFHLLYYLFYLFSPFLWETAQNDPQGLTCPNTINQISWLLLKPTDLDLHYLSLSMWNCINNHNQVIWLAEN